jgi:lysophospholipase L1-like esterase
MRFFPGQRILFQGDSITDAGRDRANPAGMGTGYAMMCAAWISASYPEHNLTFINRGISGNRAADLVDRWQEDCIDLAPDWISILIGINDTGRYFSRNEETTAEAFEQNYRKVLEHVKSELSCGLIICEPFVLPHSEDRLKWRDDLDPKIRVARKLAIEFGAIYVPFDGLFAAVCTKREASFWAPDTVHPSDAGHALMAKAWIEAVGC